MKETKLNNQILTATKWSAITEIIVKLINPVTNVFLARILAPEAFGVVATVTMIVSFAEMFTDAGFQKYLIQHAFKDREELYKNANVAFLTNLGISVILWLVITIFRDIIALSVGNPGLGDVVAISSIQLILTAFSSIQMALYKRDFDFKTLFLVRVISISIPFVVTLPLAFNGFGYWSLVIGTITIQATNAILLTIKSKWKPSLFYSLKILKEMISFSAWSLVEAISIWLTTWVDTFIIGNFLSQYFLGLYKTSTSMVNTLLSLITGATTPILFSSLSRLQDDNIKFEYLFLKFQRLVSVLVFPLGIGVFLYSDLATQILLGDQWSEASPIIGVWALTSCLMIVFGNYCSELYRARGKPKLSFFAQVLHLIVLIPACIISANYGFWTLIYTRSLIRLQFILVHLFLMKFVIGFPIAKIFKNVSPTFISSVLMGIFGMFLRVFLQEGIVWSFIGIFMCIIFYFGVLMMFPTMRREIVLLIRKVLPSKYTFKFYRR